MHNLTYFRQALSLAVVLVFGATARAATEYAVTALGPVLSTGDSGKAINSSGAVAFTESTNVYIYDNGVTTPVSGVAAGNGPLSMNDAGDLAGSNNLRGFFYKNGVLTTFGGPSNTFAQSVNDSDLVVGEQYDTVALENRAFTWQAGVLEALPGPIHGGYNANDGSSAYAVNSSGEIAGSYNNSYANGSAMVWSASLTAAILPTLSGYARSEAYDINNEGVLVGYSADANIQNSQAVMWVNGQVKALPSPLGFDLVYGNAINDDGEAVGWATHDGTPQGGDAVVWFNGALDDLNTLIPANSGWHLTDAAALNDSGYITGWGYLNGNETSFLLTPVPEPASLGLMVFAGSAMLLRRRRSGRI